MQNPIKTWLIHGIERSVERVPRGQSYVLKDDGTHVSSYKTYDRLIAEHKGKSQIGSWAVDITVSGCMQEDAASLTAEYTHSLRETPTESFKGGVDALSVTQLGRVAFNLGKISRQLEEANEQVALAGTLDY